MPKKNQLFSVAKEQSEDRTLLHPLCHRPSWLVLWSLRLHHQRQGEMLKSVWLDDSPSVLKTDASGRLLLESTYLAALHFGSSLLPVKSNSEKLPKMKITGGFQLLVLISTPYCTNMQYKEDGVEILAHLYNISEVQMEERRSIPLKYEINLAFLRKRGIQERLWHYLFIVIY